ncbi:MAG: hypothetical protein HOC71_17280 [Candidatus Latescibacteria bacterium]|jgi:hypothetical protein|nr:hypothetical protein [Candidatus Latescibacterota bacterium]
MRAKLVALLLAVCCLPGLAGQETKKLPPVDFTQDTLSLPPAYFPELPPQLRAWLEQREYRIPQVHDLRIALFEDGCFNKLDKYNVAAGDFNGAGDQDWVFVTFRDDTLRAFICWDLNVDSIEQLDISEFFPDKGGYSKRSFRDEDFISFYIVLAKINKEWLNKSSVYGIKKIYGDDRELPSPFSHDGFVFQSSGDMWDGGFVRYHQKGEWYRFYHYGAVMKATLDTLLLKKAYGNN